MKAVTKFNDPDYQAYCRQVLFTTDYADMANLYAYNQYLVSNSRDDKE